MSVSLNAKLPAGDLNGLARMTQRLTDHPDEPLYAVVRLDTRKVISNIGDDSDPWSAIVRIGWIEPAEDAEAMALLDLMSDAYATRTGKATLPWDDIPSGTETLGPEDEL